MKVLRKNATTSGASNQKWFAQIGDHYDSYVKEVGGIVATPDTQLTKNVEVAGFTVAIPDKAKTQEFREKLVQEIEAVSGLRRELAKFKIKPIAILPEDVFNKIIQKAGFYTFYQIREGNKVYGDGKTLTERKTNSSEFKFQVVFNAAIVLTFLFDALLWYIFDTSAVASFHLFALVLTAVCTSVEILQKKIGLDKIFARGIIGLLIPFLVPIARVVGYGKPRKLTNRECMELLWPNKNDVDGFEKGDLFEIRFPEPPDSVKDLLVKCYRGNIETFTSAHPDAIQVKLDDKKWKELYQKYDPIICTRKNGLVAVLDQFGDFPEEKEVVEYIKQHFDSKRVELYNSIVTATN